jgi:serine/threonine-protein kinase
LAIGAAFLAGVVVAGGAFAAYEFTSNRGGDTASGPRNTNAWPPPTSSKPSGAPKTTPPSQPPAGNVDPAALRGFLLPAPEVDALLKTSGMVPTGVVNVMAVDGVAEPARCMGVWAALHNSTYASAATTGVAGQSVAEEPKPFHRVIQGVVSFPDAAAAEAFIDLQTKQWGECQSRAIDITYGDNVEHVEIGPFVKDGDMLTVVSTPRLSADAPKITCERAMTARRNVVIDVRACAPSDVRFGASVAREIAEKVTR